MKKIKVTVLLLLTVSSLTFAQSPPKVDVNHKALESEFARLSAQYEKAKEAYYEPYSKAKTDEESAKIKLDPEKSPDKLFYPRFLSLANRAKKGSIAPKVWLKIFGITSNQPKAQDEAFGKLVDWFPDSPEVAELASQIQYSFYDLGDKRSSKVNECLDRIQAATNNPEVKAAVLYTRASLTDSNGKRDEKVSLALLTSLVATYPHSKYADLARADLYELTNLVVGKVAPDFQATDENGISFKLSDYRGKVVVLDFWGFW